MALTIKQIFLSNDNWSRFYQKYGNNIREGILLAVTKLLLCGNTIYGYHEYRCANPQCSHIKRIAHTCKGRACSSCGQKATELWIHKQSTILPKTTWQHITFTMPKPLWDLFWLNRWMLNKISPLAAHVLQTMTEKKQLTVGMFSALHTFGRDLKRNVHVHLSVTLGGIHASTKKWKPCYFPQNVIMRMWRAAVIQLFRAAYNNQTLILPKYLAQQLNPSYTFNHLLNQLYQKNWIVHCAKPSNDHKINVNYLGRYVKRPPIAASKLKHYNGQDVVFTCLNHKTNRYQRLTLSTEDFIKKFIQHIPDKYFRMIRYYGFLSNRLIGQLLPIVYELLQQQVEKITPSNYQQLIQKHFGFDPLQCILCGSQMILTYVKYFSFSHDSINKIHAQLCTR